MLKALRGIAPMLFLVLVGCEARPQVAAPSSASPAALWSGCPVTGDQVTAATGLKAGSAHFHGAAASASMPVADCSYSIGSSGFVELYDVGSLDASGYRDKISSSLVPAGQKVQWRPTPELGTAASVSCGYFKDPLLRSCLVIAFHAPKAMAVMVSTGPSKDDAARTDAAIALAQEALTK